MGLKAGLNLFRTMFGRSAKTVATHAPAPQRVTRTLTDPITGAVTGLERNITRNGEEALARLEYLPNGSTKMTIFDKNGFAPEWRTKTVTREKGASVFGGDKITVEKDYTQYWCYNEKTKLTKEYNKAGSLEHKELDYYKNSGNETFIRYAASQDKVYAEYPLTSGSKGMLNNPYESQHIQHAVDGKKNYGRFFQKETNYEKIVAAKEPAAMDAAKKAEQEAAAAKLAAEKAAAELAAKQPRINISKALGRNIDELTVKETKLANGAIERTFSDPQTGKVLAKTQDLGIGHKEWIYGGKADMIFMSQVGKDTPYIVAKKGNYTQVDYVRQDRQGNPIHIAKQYYNDGASSLERDVYNNKLCSAYGEVQVFDPSAANARVKYPNIAKDYPDYPKYPVWQGEASHGAYDYGWTPLQKRVNARLGELNTDAKQNVIDLKDLFSAYKA